MAVSSGLYHLAVNDGIGNAWLAWIPVGDIYIIARLIKSSKIGNWENEKRQAYSTGKIENILYSGTGFCILNEGDLPILVECTHKTIYRIISVVLIGCGNHEKGEEIKKVHDHIAFHNTASVCPD